MKNKFLLPVVIALTLLTAGASAQVLDFGQRSQIGISVGMMNYSGFMNKTAFTFKESHPSVEAFYRYDVAKNFNVRATFTYGSLSKDNGEESFEGANRSGQFKTNIFEATAKAQYDFLNDAVTKWSPYVIAGVGGYRLFNYTATNGSKSVSDKLGFVLPAGAGVKYKISSRGHLFLEGNVRFLSKNLDNHTGENVNNPNKYYTLALGFSYSLQKVNQLW